MSVHLIFPFKLSNNDNFITLKFVEILFGGEVIESQAYIYNFFKHVGHKWNGIYPFIPATLVIPDKNYKFFFFKKENRASNIHYKHNVLSQINMIFHGT